GGTVGAGALDAAGRLAAATSTGGRELKRPGRVGDSPIPGAGNIATAHAAVSATGWGELMLRFGTARAIAERIAAGAGAQQAVDGILAAMRARFTTPIGAIALGARGDVGVAHGTPAMPHAWRRLGDAQIRARLAAGSEGSATSR
ncbi:MAG: isoaspartyl peptidase/L-asparaginase, partial [Betaproteobacteria bacterium]|nr:isoaspartyl peptidase/L-asparaginase [Betaproteobacteria bacterium]